MTANAPTPPPSPGSDLIYPPQPAKDPAIILILNLLLFGCVGYFMMGQKMKGIATAVVWVLGLASCGIVSGLVAIFGAIDGFFQAQQHQAGYPLGPWTFFKDHR